METRGFANEIFGFNRQTATDRAETINGEIANKTSP